MKRGGWTTWTRPARRSALAGLLCVLLAPSVATATPEAYDPAEKFNRAMFWFNDKLDVYFFEPVAKGWDWLMPKPVQHSLQHFDNNLRRPLVAVNNLLQGKPRHAWLDTGRFAINTTVGVLGFLDPATGWGFPHHDEDFGQTLGVWGIPPGPYVVIPFFGPITYRHAVGRFADSFGLVYPWVVDTTYTIGLTAVTIVNGRAQVLDQVREAKRASLDYYVFVRDAYTQRRHALVNDLEGMSEEEEADLYFEEYEDEEQ